MAQRNSTTSSTSSTAKSAATIKRTLVREVHGYIRSKNFDALAQVLQKEDDDTNGNEEEINKNNNINNLLWETATSNWTALHVAARSMMNEQYYHRGASVSSGGSSSSSTSHIIGITRGASCNNNRVYNIGILQVPANNGHQRLRCGCCSRCDPWKWLLQQAALSSSADSLSSFSDGSWLARDKGGETCFDIFFASWLSSTDPLALSFQRSLNEVLKKDSLISELRNWILATTTTTQVVAPNNINNINNNNNNPQHRHHVEVVFRVWKAMELLCRAAATTTVISSNKNNNNSCCFFAIVPFLARLGSSPERIARLALALFPEQAWTPCRPQRMIVCKNSNNKTTTKAAAAAPPPSSVPSNSTLPLHIWAQSPNPPDPDLNGLLLVLLETYPAAVQCADEKGRLPLHWALDQQHGRHSSGNRRSIGRSNKPFHTIPQLWQTHLKVLGVVDGITQLPCFALAAVAAGRVERRSSNQAHRTTRQPAVSLHDWLQTNNISSTSPFVKNKERNDQNCQALTVIFQMVRTLPVALQDFSTFLASNKDKN